MSGEDKKMIREFLIFKERPSKLEKGYSQDLVKQTVDLSVFNDNTNRPYYNFIDLIRL